MPLLFKYRYQAAVFLAGLLLLGGGILASKIGIFRSSRIEVIDSGNSEEEAAGPVVEVSGAVNSPGVYELGEGARVEDALSAAGWFSEDADMDVVEKIINRASRVADGQKIYIPSFNTPEVLKLNTSGVLDTGLINLNTASQNALESLWGIGPVTAQNIIEQRPYSTVQELLDKGILKSNVYERNKDLLTVF